MNIFLEFQLSTLLALKSPKLEMAYEHLGWNFKSISPQIEECDYRLHAMCYILLPRQQQAEEKFLRCSIGIGCWSS